MPNYVNTVQHINIANRPPRKVAQLVDISGKQPRVVMVHELVAFLKDSHRLNVSLMKEMEKAYAEYVRDVTPALKNRVIKPYHNFHTINFPNGGAVSFDPLTTGAPVQMCLFEDRVYRAMELTHTRALALPRPGQGGQHRK